jgi:peroxiredoxin
MKIKIKDKIPNIKIYEYLADGELGRTVGINHNEIYSITDNKTVVITSVPGAFTPTCSEKHLPDYVKNYRSILEAGVDTICFISVNDPFVMSAWGKINNVPVGFKMLADSNAEFAKVIGSDIDLTDAGLGLRSIRYTLVVKNNYIEYLNIDESPADYKNSSVKSLLEGIVNK